MNSSSNQNNVSKSLFILTTPIFVPETENPAFEPSETKKKRMDKFAELPRFIKHKLIASETSQKIQFIGQKYGFELLRLTNITRLIREYYFGEVRFENFPAEIEKRMGVSLLTAQEITRYIKSEIIDWDPWAEYLAKLPKMPIREIAQKFPKIVNTEITSGYVELRGSDDFEDPSIKNWIKDYISHLGYEKHSQMDRTQYIFHSENGKNLSSQDREKLGIILKSFDENIPLPVDEENGEIVFESVISEPASSAGRQRTVNNNPMPAAVPKLQPTPIKQDSFIKPYSPIQQPQKQAPRPAPAPVRNTPSQNFIKPVPVPQFQPAANIPDNFASQNGPKPEIDKYFNAPETPEIPSIKIHSITEHNEPKMAQQVPPRQNISRPVQTLPPRQASSPQPSPLHTGGQAYQGEGVARPKHRMIEPFGPKMVEPRLDGNIVDLSEQ